MPQTKEMVEDVTAAMGSTLSEITWMDAATKKEARRKLDDMLALVGLGENDTNAAFVNELYGAVSAP